MPLHTSPQTLGVERACRPDRRQDPTTRGVELLVACSARPQCVLVDAVAPEARMRVAVDEPRQRGLPAPVDLDEIAVEPIGSPELTHPANRGDPSPFAEDERVFDHVDRSECVPSERRGPARRTRNLREIANEHPLGRSALVASAHGGKPRPCSRAALSASP